jgi:hypothetical protein
LIDGNIYHETMFFPTAMGAAFVEAGLAVVNGETLEPVTDADIFGMTTPKATQMLAGELDPPRVFPSLRSSRKPGTDNADGKLPSGQERRRRQPVVMPRRSLGSTWCPPIWPGDLRNDGGSVAAAAAGGSEA